MAKGKLSAFRQGDVAVIQETGSGAAVRALQVVDHAGVKQSLKQGDDFVKAQFVVLVADDVGGEVEHEGSISTRPACVNRVATEIIYLVSLLTGPGVSVTIRA